MSIPRARFLPQNPPLILPRQHRASPIPPPVSRLSKWTKPVVMVLAAVAFVILLFGLYGLGVKYGLLPGQFIRAK